MPTKRIVGLAKSRKPEGTTCRPIYTIGHSDHPVERFVSLLERHRVDAVADVRSAPHSRWQPHFNRENLRRELRARGVGYVFLGRELGARSDDPGCYDELGRVSYRRLAATPLFQSGIRRLQRGSDRMTIALMCAEREPLECHRTILVARELEARGTPVVHILADGNTESHDETLARLADRVGVPDFDFFRTGEELRDEAYAKLERQIAYRRPTQDPPINSAREETG